METPTDADLARIALSAEAQARIGAATQGITDEKLRGRVQTSLLNVARLEEWKRQHHWQPCPRCGTLTAPEAETDLPLCDFCRSGISPSHQ